MSLNSLASKRATGSEVSRIRWSAQASVRGSIRLRWALPLARSVALRTCVPRPSLAWGGTPGASQRLEAAVRLAHQHREVDAALAVGPGTQRQPVQWLAIVVGQ